MMSDYIKLEIEDRVYALHPMPPTKALEFAPRVSTALSGVMANFNLPEMMKTQSAGNEMGLATIVFDAVKSLNPTDFISLFKTAVSYEVFAGDKKLSDNLHFDDWFTKYPGDMLPVGCWAIWEHSKKYFLESPAGFRKVFGTMELPSLKGGNQPG